LWRHAGGRIFRSHGRPRCVRKLLLAYLPAAVWAALIATVAGLGSVSAVPAVPGVDKLGHFGLYGVFGWLLGRGWLHAGRRPARGWLVLLGLLLGVSDELRHARLPDRSAEIGDWLADGAGLLTGIGLATYWRRREHDEREHEHR
jgi:VanZ family protein